MSEIGKMRIGDTIISADGDVFEIYEIGVTTKELYVRAVAENGWEREFMGDKFFSVDEGHWQETAI